MIINILNVEIESKLISFDFLCAQGNYVLDRDEQLDHVKEEYDTILALSITKWIHLNNGDAGLIRAFHRMFKQLRPGGVLVLEPQAWNSYRRRKKLTVSDSSIV
jgi:7SK snRNA methylphosphate capping enzyme